MPRSGGTTRPLHIPDGSGRSFRSDLGSDSGDLGSDSGDLGSDSEHLGSSSGSIWATSPVLHYDPLGRLIRTQLPNGTEARVEFSAWEQRDYDPNDTVMGSTWHTDRLALPVGDPQRRAAVLTEGHADTPTVTHLDHLGRAFLAVEHNRDDDGLDVLLETRAQLDVSGNILQITDALGTVAEQRTPGMQGQVLHTTSLEVGERWMLSDTLGAPLYTSASRGFSTRHRYDAARRPTHTIVTRPDGTTFTGTRQVYGEVVPDAESSNLRGQLYRIYDGAGLQEHQAFDVDGHLVQQSRRLAVAYDITPDWGALDALTEPAELDAATAALLEAESFTTDASFDALGRPVTQTTPDASVVHLGYGDAGHLETVAANVRGDVTPTDIVTDLRYNARGQRTLVVYGNGTQTAYTHDPQTFRLTRLHTLRTADSHPHQDLRYTYDPVGNVTEIRDLAQPVVFTNNAAISANQRFEYDPLYRLVHAEGREHQSTGQPTDVDVVPRTTPDDPTGLRNYIEQYLYDAVGNILELQHSAPGGSWTRSYSYDPTTAGNRLLATSAPGDAPGVHSLAYTHDAHGNMTAMPHLAAIGWDWADRMQSADLGGGGTVYFAYDASGQRIRKVRRNLASTSTWERIYLGAFEVYRERVDDEVQLERQTLHINDNAGRVCMVETKTIEDALPIASPANIARYQYGNHLGTVGLELDGSGQLISYEEFHPYGTTAYRATNSAVEVSPSRYRYTGKERDEETGLGHHGARYYASWLARWTSADPIGLGDGINRFAYVRGSPVTLLDPSGTQAAPGFEHLTVRVTTGRGSGGKGPTVLESEGGDPGSPPSAKRSSKRERENAAQRSERRVARRAAREAKLLDATVDMAIAQYEQVLRAEDTHRIEQLEAIADRLGYYPTGRVASYFEPGSKGRNVSLTFAMSSDARSDRPRTCPSTGASRHSRKSTRKHSRTLTGAPMQRSTSRSSRRRPPSGQASQDGVWVQSPRMPQRGECLKVSRRGSLANSQRRYAKARVILGMTLRSMEAGPQELRRQHRISTSPSACLQRNLTT